MGMYMDGPGDTAAVCRASSWKVKGTSIHRALAPSPITNPQTHFKHFSCTSGTRIRGQGASTNSACVSCMCCVVQYRDIQGQWLCPMGVKTTCEFGRWPSRHLWEGSQLTRPMSPQMWSSATIIVPWTILIVFLFEKKVIQTNDSLTLYDKIKWLNVSPCSRAPSSPSNRYVLPSPSPTVGFG